MGDKQRIRRLIASFSGPPRKRMLRVTQRLSSSYSAALDPTASRSHPPSPLWHTSICDVYTCIHSRVPMRIFTDVALWLKNFLPARDRLHLTPSCQFQSCAFLIVRIVTPQARTGVLNRDWSRNGTWHRNRAGAEIFNVSPHALWAGCNMPSYRFSARMLSSPEIRGEPVSS